MKTRAVLMAGYGGPEVLQIGEVEICRQSPDDVLIRVLAVSVNHLDIEIRAGTSRMLLPLPHVLGREIVGEVLETAEIEQTTDTVRVGDRVLVLPNTPCGSCPLCLRGRSNLCRNAYMPGITRWGGYAEHVAVPSRALIPIGDLDPTTAAATPISFGTAWRMLYSLGHLKPGEKVLVSGAAGGLGHAAVQLARLGGAHVVGLVGDSSKADFVTGCGASSVISTRTNGWSEEAMEASGGDGFDLIVEHVGGEVFERCLGLLAPTGRMMIGGGHAGEHPQLDVIETFRNEFQLLGVRSQRPDEIAHVLRLASEGQIRPHVDRVLPLEQASSAHEAIASRTVRGKQVLVP
jgi:NADPH:quinone reductase-like Zn-dependent oxidoreductase